VPEFFGRITGTLADGTPVDLPFWRDEGSTLALPEPRTHAAALVASLVLALIARRARSASLRAGAAAE
jgi:hypothetical protein